MITRGPELNQKGNSTSWTLLKDKHRFWIQQQGIARGFELTLNDSQKFSLTLNDSSRFSPPYTSIPVSYPPRCQKYSLFIAYSPPDITGDLRVTAGSRGHRGVTGSRWGHAGSRWGQGRSRWGHWVTVGSRGDGGVTGPRWGHWVTVGSRGHGGVTGSRWGHGVTVGSRGHGGVTGSRWSHGVTVGSRAVTVGSLGHGWVTMGSRWSQYVRSHCYRKYC